jgi:hypothetical protein
MCTAQDARLEWAEERNVYSRALDEATSTINLLDRMARDLRSEKSTLDESLEVAQEGGRDLVRALEAARAEAAEAKGQVEEVRREAKKAEQDRARERAQHAKAIKALQERCVRARINPLGRSVWMEGCVCRCLPSLGSSIHPPTHPPSPPASLAPPSAAPPQVPPRRVRAGGRGQGPHQGP